MSTDSSLQSAISSSRKVSEDGSMVTYDLTKNVDFSDPRKVAEALAQEFYESDAKEWFKVTGDHVDFNPTHKVRIVMAEEHSRKIEETVGDFLKDLQKEELYPNYAKQIDDVAESNTSLHSAMGAHVLRAVAFHHFDKKVFEDYMRDDLFLDILGKLEIRSLNDEDLINWKNLPL